MWVSEVGAPVSSANWHDGEFSQDDGATNSGSDFLRALDTESDVTLRVADDNESLESRTLTSTGLFLDRHDLHDLVLEAWKEVVDDLVLLDRERVEVDFFDGLDLSCLYKSSELGDWDPLLLTIVFPATTSTTASASTAVSSTTSVSASTTEA